jgi:hypothetical protein
METKQHGKTDLKNNNMGRTGFEMPIRLPLAFSSHADMHAWQHSARQHLRQAVASQLCQHSTT